MKYTSIKLNTYCIFFNEPNTYCETFNYSLKERRKSRMWKRNKKKDGLLNSNLAVHEINFPWARVNFCHMAASLCTYHNWLWTFMLPCGIATFDKLNNFYSFLILVHFYRDFAQFGHVVSLGHYVMGSEEILKFKR